MDSICGLCGVRLTRFIVRVGYNIVNTYIENWGSDNSMDIMRGVGREYAMDARKTRRTRVDQVVPAN